MPSLPQPRVLSLAPEPTGVSAREVIGLPSRPNLSAREVEVLLAWIRCDSKPAVAASLFLSLGTVNTHMTRIRAKYAAVGRPAPTKASLVARALQDGLIDITEL
ncbi:hypothetical protein GCM10007304_02230 [Rhodococcoides trifolii]|uniref:HTH luxR-type domain-containing protein n=1 Tax=Rhodococcoides trifolii TaxID=908250 RepID=A0A917CN79_9NOCA|nr:hypothetical protein GCM10007304_02230 [Rhodococcus trifolii]